MVKAIQRNRAGPGPNRPIGTFIFLGPTGVGKTSWPKELARCLFDTEDAPILGHERAWRILREPP